MSKSPPPPNEMPANALAKILSGIPSAFMRYVINHTYGVVTGTACALQYCKPGNSGPFDYFDTWSVCGLIYFLENNLRTGIPPYPNSFLDACANYCLDLTRKKEFRKECCMTELKSGKGK